MEKLLECYAERGPRAVVSKQGTPVSPAVCATLLSELRGTAWPAGAARERPKVSAAGQGLTLVHFSAQLEPCLSQ
jgi:hypothetical protein